MRYRISRLGWMVLVVIAINCVSAAVSFAQPRIEEIREELRSRANRLRSGRVEWRDRTLHTPESFRLETPSSIRALASKRGITAGRELICERKMEFLWDGAKMSFHYDGSIPSRFHDKPIDRKYDGVCGGKVGSRMLLTDSDVEHPTGTIYNYSKLENLKDIDLIPILMWARPLDPDCCGIGPNAKVLPGNCTFRKAMYVMLPG